MECLRLRIKDIELAHNKTVAREGKGNKDRVTMLPGAVKEPLQAQLRQFGSTANFRYLRRQGFFRVLGRRADDYRLFFFPAWKRTTVWFLSAAGVLLLLKMIGVEL